MDFDTLALGEFKPRPKILPSESVLYRGWVLSLTGYQQLIPNINQYGSRLVTGPEQYGLCHHLPGWYCQCADLTAETHFFETGSLRFAQIEALSWNSYFVKDFVKFNSGGKGSIATSSSEVQAIIDELKPFRGDIEGGIAIRRVEDYFSIPNSAIL